MSNVINRTTLEYLQSVNTPDYPDSDWIINPDLSLLDDVDPKYWKISGDQVVSMSAQEIAAIDSTDLVQLKLDAIAGIQQAGDAAINVAYSQTDRISLVMIYMQAVKLGLTSRQAYVIQVLGFMASVITYRSAVIARMNLAANADALAAVAYSFTQPNIGNDPKITVAAALAIAS